MSPSKTTSSHIPTSKHDEDDLLPYSPHPVPPHEGRHLSYRDDVRRTLYRHKFKPSRSRYTTMADLYSLFLSDNGHGTTTKDLDLKFRSALGRVLRPPSSADAFAASYAAPSVHIQRSHGFISMVSPHCSTVDLEIRLKELKQENGRNKREQAKHSDVVDQKRESRRNRRLNQLPPEPEIPQHVSFRYVDEFLALKSAEDLLNLKIFPNGKEMAESMSAYAAVREYLHRDKTAANPITLSDKNVKLLAVGDGCTPRTATLFAYRTQWQCVSVDPEMRNGPWDDTVSSLTTMRARIQDVSIPFDTDDQRIIVIMWHAHVSIRDAVSCLSVDGEKWDTSDRNFSAAMRSRVALISCACCNYDKVQQKMPDGTSPDAHFEDVAVPGEKRTVRVWKFTPVS